MRYAVVGSLALAAMTNFAHAQSLTEVANNTALRTLKNYAYPVVRAGYASAGDGGIAVYEHTTSACTLNAGAGDNGSQIEDAAGTGCWNIDWSSVNNIASVCLFETNCGAGNVNTDPVALQAALNTGRDVLMPVGVAGAYQLTAEPHPPLLSRSRSTTNG